MISDKILLESAAKATGFTVLRSRLNDPMHKDFLLKELGPRNPGQKAQPWNPLTDDGDALRLAVKMNIWFHTEPTGYAVASSDSDGTYEHVVRYSDVGGDPCAAARRAIVLTVASIGASKE